jgi:1,4-alpha-glucan branching enzyme
VTLVLVAAVTWIVWPAVPSPSPTRGPDQPEAASAVETTTASTDRDAETVWSRFVYTANDADSVAVAGDFSNWEPIPLSPHTVNGETVWTGLVPVSRGEHEYQFVIDGEKWVTDPLAPVKQDDGFGAKNAVLKL